MRIGTHYDALIWDFDGTVMDTYPEIVAAYLDAARSGFGLDVDFEAVWGWAKNRLGVCRRNIAERAGVTPEEVENEFAVRYEKRDVSSERFFPGAVSVLRAVILSGGRNFLVTHRSGRSLDEYIAIHDLRRYFVEAVPMLESFPAKPAPHAFLYLIAKYRLDPGHCLGVGDRGLDIEAALAAGVDGCFFDPDGAVYSRATYSIRRLEELLRIL